MDWPLRDLFLAYIHKLQVDAEHAYEMQLLTWAVLAPYQKRQSKPPDVPKILKG